MTHYSIKFEPVNPLVLNKPSEFTDSAPLSANLKESYSFPSIFTCVGALSTALLDFCGISINKNESWINNIKRIFNQCNIKEVFGVVIEYNQNDYYYIGGNYFVRKEVLEKLFKEIKNMNNSKSIKDNLIELLKRFRKKDTLPKVFTEWIKSLNDSNEKIEYIEAKQIKKASIQLGNNKRVEEGHLFFVSYVDYFVKQPENNQNNDINHNINNNIRYKIYIETNNEEKLYSLNNNIVRFGGESRIVSLSLEKHNSNIEIKKWDNIENRSFEQLSRIGCNCYIKVFEDDHHEVRLLTSHLIIPYEENDEDSFLIEEKLRTIYNKIGLNYEEDLIWGSLNYIGGYDVNRNLRKPMYIALEPGTIIIKKGEN